MDLRFPSTSEARAAAGNPGRLEPCGSASAAAGTPALGIPLQVFTVAGAAGVGGTQVAPRAALGKVDGGRGKGPAVPGPG